jgi:hypothetical protein
VKPAGLSTALRTRLPEAGSDRDGHAVDVAAHHLELVPLADRALVDVAGEDQLGSGVDERCEDVGAARDRLLPRSPGGADQVVLQRGDANGSGGRLREQPASALEL